MCNKLCWACAQHAPIGNNHAHFGYRRYYNLQQAVNQPKIRLQLLDVCTYNDSLLVYTKQGVISLKAIN